MSDHVASFVCSSIKSLAKLQLWNRQHVNYGNAELLKATFLLDMKLLSVGLVPLRIKAGFYAYLGEGRITSLDTDTQMRAFLGALKHSELLPPELCVEAGYALPDFAEKAQGKEDLDRVDLFRETLDLFSEGVPVRMGVVEDLAVLRIQYRNKLMVTSYIDSEGDRELDLDINGRKLGYVLGPGETLSGLLSCIEASLATPGLTSGSYPDVMSFISRDGQVARVSSQSPTPKTQALDSGTVIENLPG